MVGDVQQVSVSGLEGTEFFDKTDSFKRKKQYDTASLRPYSAG